MTLHILSVFSAGQKEWWKMVKTNLLGVDNPPPTTIDLEVRLII